MKNEETFCIVLTTFESEEQADKISEEIIKNKLAACIQYIPINMDFGANCCYTIVIEEEVL